MAPILRSVSVVAQVSHGGKSVFYRRNFSLDRYCSHCGSKPRRSDWCFSFRWIGGAGELFYRTLGGGLGLAAYVSAVVGLHHLWWVCIVSIPCFLTLGSLITFVQMNKLDKDRKTWSE